MRSRISKGPYKITDEVKQDILPSKLKVAELAVKHGLGVSTVYLVINSRNLKQTCNGIFK
jgi:hypothetical protein